MKLTLVLALSLALNAVGAVLFLLGRNSPAPATAPVQAVAPARTPAPTLSPEVWPALETTELPTLIDRLKASGFPPDMVRAVVAAQINELFAARRRALLSTAANRPYWKDGAPDHQTIMAQRELAREQQKLMRDLFGETAEGDDPMRSLYPNRSLEFLPADKAGEVRRIIRDFEERRLDLFSSGVLMDREKINALEKEQQAMIGQVLSADELKEYNVRNSSTANNLREQLAGFNPTEEEFRAIFALRYAFDERFGTSFSITMSPAEQRARMEAEKVLTEQIKASLSAPRAAEYDRGTDFNYRRTSQLVNRLELPAETAANLWNVQKEFERRRNDLYRSSSGPADSRNQQLAEMQQEAVARITPLLGSAQNVEAYKQYGGQWLETFLPRRMPAPTRQ